MRKQEHVEAQARVGTRISGMLLQSGGSNRLLVVRLASGIRQKIPVGINLAPPQMAEASPSNLRTEGNSGMDKTSLGSRGMASEAKRSQEWRSHGEEQASLLFAEEATG
mmetsp:Transcript_55258/g.124032  ORF Transcript_55258/g.124032 Transcript_55258/m.124032 type:complete len:109 (-) Transcript_55258:39-365(-)